MNKILDYINEHRWIKFLSLLFGFSPVAKWINDHIESSIQTTMLQAHSFDYFGLITAILTTLLLWLAFATSWAARGATKKAQEQLEVSEELLKAYKTVGALSHAWIRFKLYTGDGLNTTYNNPQLREHLETTHVSQEMKYVFKQIQDTNPQMPPAMIHKLMVDFYNLPEQQIISLLR